MFDNIGERIKELALSIFVIEVIAAVVSGIIMIVAGGDDLIVVGILTMIIGSALAYLSVILIYAFGELVENSTIIANCVANNEEARTNSSPRFAKKNIGPDYWLCPKCGKSNHNTAGTCACGHRKEN